MVPLLSLPLLPSSFLFFFSLRFNEAQSRDTKVGPLEANYVRFYQHHTGPKQENTRPTRNDEEPVQQNTEQKKEENVEKSQEALRLPEVTENEEERMYSQPIPLKQRQAGANYWNRHGIFFLLGLLCFPRFTLIFLSSFYLRASLMNWLFLLCAPHLTVAFLSMGYFNDNPFLVMGAWLAIFGGETVEKRVIRNIWVKKGLS